MMAKTKPYTEAQRRIFYQLAAVMVCSEIESQVIAPLNKNPEFRRAFETLGRAITRERKNQLQLAKAARSKHGS